MKLNRIILIALLSMGLISCENFKLDDLLENPNSVAPEQAEIDFLYNNIVLSFNGFTYSYWDATADLSRMTAMTGGFTYNNAFQAVSFNGTWFSAYSNLIPDIDALIATGTERGLNKHVGSAKIMKAYILMTLVDLFGDVPYSQAFQGTDVISPAADDGAAVYNAALALLDEAIGDLNGTEAATPANDIFYNGDADKWITAANSLKLRMYNTMGNKTSEMNELIAGGNLIDDASEDFQFTFGNNRNNPNSRHPFYNNSYEAVDGNYMSNYYMWLMVGEKDVEDPRSRFYFYRQDGDLTDEDENIWDCIISSTPFNGTAPPHYTAVDPDMPYCIAGVDGFFGRDHGNGSGIPPDGPVRAVYGLYPGGGSFDDNSFDFTQQLGTTGALGQGITPFMLSSYVSFIRAEAALKSGTSDNARDMLQQGIEQSMDKVFSFQSFLDPGKVVGRDVEGNDITLKTAYLDPLEDKKTAYVDAVLAEYDAADEDGKWDIIMKEYYIALWGNGLESYNNYRRTGKPNNMQPPIEIAPGNFMRSFLYPAVHVNLNQNATQKANNDVQVFWDTNPANPNWVK